MKMSPLSIHSKLLSAQATPKISLLLSTIVDLLSGAYSALRIPISEGY